MPECPISVHPILKVFSILEFRLMQEDFFGTPTGFSDLL